MTGPDPLAALRALHAEIDDGAAALAARHAARLQCGVGCHGCCVDGLRVFEIEAERIRREHGELLAAGRPHPAGGCAFLDERGACRIYRSRPYVCRTQGLPLRWLEAAADGGWTERRDICPLNAEGGEPPERLPAADCWTVGPTEGRLAALQRRFGGGLRRVALRALFRSGLDRAG